MAHQATNLCTKMKAEPQNTKFIHQDEDRFTTPRFIHQDEHPQWEAPSVSPPEEGTCHGPATWALEAVSVPVRLCAPISDHFGKSLFTQTTHHFTTVRACFCWLGPKRAHPFCPPSHQPPPSLGGSWHHALVAPSSGGSTGRGDEGRGRGPHARKVGPALRTTSRKYGPHPAPPPVQKCTTL